MRKFTIFSLLMIFSIAMFAQLQKAPFHKGAPGTITTKDALIPVTTLSYCDDIVATSIGMNADAYFGVYVSFDATTMGAYVGNFINEVQIGVTQLTNIDSLEIRIYEDTTGAGAGGGTPVATQFVDVTTLIDGWNNITLTTPYTITGNEVFIGYWIHTLGGYPCSASAGPAVDPAGGWVCDASGWGSLAGYGLDYNWQVRAIVDDGVVVNDDAGVIALAVPYGCELTATETITATVQNFGNADITADFDMAYTLNGGTPVTVVVPAGTTPIAVGGTLDVNFTVDMSVPNAYQFVAYTMLTNDGYLLNDTTYMTTANVAPSNTPYAVTFNNDFVGWNTQDVNGDASVWNAYTGTGLGNTDDFAFLYMFNATNAADDWAYSTCLNLDATKTYELGFFYKVGDVIYPEKLSVSIGTAQDAAAMTTQIVDLGVITDTLYVQSLTQFTVPTTGVYYIGFHAYSDPDMWYVAIDDVTVDEVVGIADETVAENISIYPNPTTGTINITNAENADVLVYNMVGEVVLSVDNISRTIDISKLAEGTYIVKVVTDNNVKTQKINLFK